MAKEVVDSRKGDWDLGWFLMKLGRRMEVTL